MRSAFTFILSEQRFLTSLVSLVLLLQGCVQGRKVFTVREIIEPPAPTNLYEEVLRSLDDAQAYSKIKFSAGDVALDERSRLLFDEGTEAGLSVNVRGGVVDSGDMEFTRRVHVVVQGIPMSFRKLHAGANGEIDPVDLEFDSVGQSLLFAGELPKIRQLIAQRARIPTDLYSLFVSGTILTTSARKPPTTAPTPQFRDAVAPPEHALDSQPMFLAATGQIAGKQPLPSFRDRIDEVIVRIEEATLRQGSLFLLHDYEHWDAVHRTRLVIGPQSSARISSASLLPKKGKIDAHIDLSLTALQSSIVTEGRRFDFDSGSKLVTRGLNFTKDPEGWAFSTPPGSGYAELVLKAGEFALEGSNLQLSSGSSIAVYSLDLRAASGSALKFSGSGRLALNVESGSLHFNTLPGDIERAYLALNTGSRLVAEGGLYPVQQGTGPAWQVRDGQARIDLNVEEGVFDLGPAGVVLCGPGTRMESARIDFDTRRKRNFSGSLDMLRVQDVRATLKGTKFQSVLQLDPGSFLMLGDGSNLLLTDAVLSSTEPQFQGWLYGNLLATGGTLKYGDSTFVLADRGSRAEFKKVRLDTQAKRFVSGILDRIACVVQSTRISSGSYIKNLSLAAGSSAVLSPVNIDHDTGHVTGSLHIDAVATDGGELAVGPGKTIFPFKTGTFFKATDLTVDSDATSPVHGVIQAAAFTTEGGRVDLAALSNNDGGSGFVNVAGTVSLNDVTYPTNVEGAKGRAHFGKEVEKEDVQFSGGTWAMGPATLRLRSGRLRGPLTWEQNGKEMTYVFRPSVVEANIATTLQEINTKIGSRPEDVPCVLATGVLNIKGNATEFQLRAEGVSIEGSMASPFVRHAEGIVSVGCVDNIALDASLDGQIYIPCDGDAKEAGAKSFGQRLEIGPTISGGWSLAGPLKFDSEKSGSSLTLAQVKGAPISLSILNKSQNGADERVILVDGRKMVGIEIDYFVDSYVIHMCARITVRWWKGSVWHAAISNPRLELTTDKIALSAELTIPEELTVKKHAQSSAGLSWDGNDAVEDLDLVLKGVGFGSISKKLNGVINDAILPAIKEKVSKIEFKMQP